MKSKFIILRGKPTSGKSTAYANLRKNKIMKEWFFVDYCALKESLGKELGKKSLFAILKVVMPTKRNIIIEEMSEETIRKYINNEIKKYNYKITVFQFRVNTKTAFKRDIKRAKEKWHPFMGKRKIKEMHNLHDERLDKKTIIVDTNRLGKKKVIDLILKEAKK